MNDSLGDRIKSNYEDAYRFHIPNRLPMVIRLDGKSFSSYTRDCKKPFDDNVIRVMDETASYLCRNIQGAKIAYLQSDEISILIYNHNYESQGWFNGNLQKIASVSAGMASAVFTSLSGNIFGGTMKLAVFDARVFVVPFDEATNYFAWRQQDCIRNSIQSLARSLYSHKECDNKNQAHLKEMCAGKGVDWDKLAMQYQRGKCIIKEAYMKDDVRRTRWIVGNEIPIFSENRNYIDHLLANPKDE